MTRLGAVAVRASGLRWLPLVVTWVLACAPSELVYRLLASLPIFHFCQSASCSLDLPIRLMPTNALLNHSSPLPSTLECATNPPSLLLLLLPLNHQMRVAPGIAGHEQYVL